jgi:DNA polymerase III subunit beta
MKFTAEKSDLLKHAQNAERGVPSGVPSIPVLSCLRLDLDETNNTLTVRGTDLSFGVTTSLKVRASSGGSTCVNAKLFTQVVKSLQDGAVTVEVVAETKMMKISSGPSQFELRTVAVNEFPAGEKFDAKDEFSLSASAFVKGLRKVTNATSSDTARPILGGVHVVADKENDTVSFAATDSYRLSVVDLSGLGASFADDTKVTIPGKTLDELVRYIDDDSADIGVTLSDKSVQFRVGDTKFFTRLIEGTYPAYEKLLSVEANYTVTVNAETMIGTLKRVQIMNDPNSVIPARFDFDDDGLRVSCSKTDVGVADERVDVTLDRVNAEADDEVDGGIDADETDSDGAAFSIGFNPKYMIDGLNAFGGEDVVLHINNELKPVLVTSAKVPELRYILMPVRL